MKAKFAQDLTKRILESLPSNLTVLKKDLEDNIKQCVTNSLQKFDLVTREEFDIQAKALKKAQQELTQLNQKVTELEQQINKN